MGTRLQTNLGCRAAAEEGDSKKVRKENFYFIVRIRPSGPVCNGKEVRRYVREAIGCWGGGGDPDDPFFGLRHERDVTVTPYKKRKKMPKIPVNLNDQPREQEPLDEGIPYTGIIRKVQISDNPDKNGVYYLTGGQVEITEPEEWKGRSAFFNYIPLPQPLTPTMNIAERRKAEEKGIEFARLCDAFKIPHDEDGVDTDDMVGCEGMFMARNEEYQGRKIPRVATFLI